MRAPADQRNLAAAGNAGHRNRYQPATGDFRRGALAWEQRDAELQLDRPFDPVQTRQGDDHFQRDSPLLE